MKKMPELKNKKLEEAKKILDDLSIKYDDHEEKEFSFNVRRGRVIRTEPKENESIKKEQEVKIYVSKLSFLPLILILFFLIIGIFLFNFVGTAIINGRVTIARTYQGWVKSDVVYVTKDANINKLDKYEYCITENKTTKKCVWKETNTKNTELSETGKWNVFFRAKYKDGKYSSTSNRVQVLIDNVSPVISKIDKKASKNSLKLDITATDIGSGIKDYYYKIGSSEYKKANDSFVINGLVANTEYTITIRVIDNADNEYELTFKTKTSDKNENNSNNDKEDNNKTTTKVNNSTTKPNGGSTNNVEDNKTTTKPVTTTKKEETTTKKEEITTNKEETTTTTSTKPIEPVIEIPQIDLNDVPSVFEYGSNYKLPSHVKFGKSGGTYSCAINDDWSKNVETTEDIAVGVNIISCKAISNTGSKAEVSKEVKVTVPAGEDEEWDGWIRLNLYYPTASTNREWRIHREGEIRGSEDNWQAYTGPILVKISDIENVYIRYDLNGEKVVELPSNKVLVDIEAEEMVLDEDSTTKVTITYDKNAKTKEYRINGGKWQKYTDEFTVTADTLIEARAEREEKVYDSDNNYIMTKTLVGTDSLYIAQKSEVIGSKIDFGTVNISIISDKNSLKGDEKTNVEINYESDAETKLYKINEGPWLEYTGPFIVGKNTTIYAKAESTRKVTLENGIEKYGKALGSARKTIIEASSSGEPVNPDDPVNPDKPVNPGEPVNPGDPVNPGEPVNPGDDPQNYLRVYIKSSASRVLKGKKAKIELTSSNKDAKLYYSLDDKNYVEYTGVFEVGANTRVYAYAEMGSEKAYDTIYIGVVETTEKLVGPTISQTPQSITESVTITISTEEEAEDIYYSIDGNRYEKYTGEFQLTKNGIVRSYYIRKSDNKKSETTALYVQNISEPNKPYVRIDAKPSIYLTEDIDTVVVSISGTNYDTLEYSFNGIEYYEYVSPLQITQSKSVYAKGTNRNGTTIEKLNIITSVAPIPVEKLDVAITLTPEEKEVTELIDKVEVTINYDERATEKYYRIGDGQLQKYTGPFEVNENTTIYGYAVSNKGIGSTSKQINYLTTGIANPIINVTPNTPAEWVSVEIEYAKTASVKKYKIDNGEWLDYNGPIEIMTNNVKVRAYNEDILGHHEEAEILIDNIIPRENISVLDNGMYYLIKLNYPTSSIPSDREYKWKKDGNWKKYDEKGILLIRPEYKDKVISSDGVKIKDSNGQEIILKDNYYILDVPLSELAENIFMRWDLTKPSTPTFIISTEEWAKEITVGINYDKSCTEKLYKIVYEDGTDTGWKNYDGPVTIDKNNAIIYAKSINDVEIQSEIGSKKITNIDTIYPEIEVIGNFETPAQKASFQVNGIDNGEVSKVAYAKGEKELDYFKDNGKTINNNATVTVEENGKYTIYVEDSVGNAVIKVIEIANIDKEPPKIVINVLTEEFGIEAEINIDYGDAVTKQYSIGNNNNYKDYTDNLKINSNDVLDLVNEDGTLTIYAKGKDALNNEAEVSKKISVLDLDVPTKPVIHASTGYPIITGYGIKFGDKLSVTFDSRYEMDNYISFDGGATWQLYDEPVYIDSGNIMAKSVKKNSGLTVTSSKDITVPTNALSPKVYDGNINNSFELVDGYGTHHDSYIDVSEEMIGKKFDLLVSYSNSASLTVTFLNESGGEISSKTSKGSKATNTYTIPEGTKQIKFAGDRPYVRLHELTIINIPVITESKIYPVMHEYGIEAGYNEIIINYFPTSEQKLYRINGGEWKNYNGETIKVKINDKVEAKGVDKFGVETKLLSYTSSLISTGLPSVVYDGYTNKYFDLVDGNGTYHDSYIDVSEEMAGKQINLTVCCFNGAKLIVTYLNASGGTISSFSYNAPASPTTNTYTIPEGTKRIKFAGNWAYVRLYELAVKDPVPKSSVQQNIVQNDSLSISEPVIKIDSNDISSTKTISIDYISGYTNEYSIDLGETWIPYIAPLNFDRNITVIARVRNGDNILSSSSFTITKIKEIDESSNYNIPDEFFEGDEYKLPDSCTINDMKYSNIKELGVGNYNLVCKLADGESPLVNKQIIIKRREENNSEVDGNE